MVSPRWSPWQQNSVQVLSIIFTVKYSCHKNAFHHLWYPNILRQENLAFSVLHGQIFPNLFLFFVFCFFFGLKLNKIAIVSDLLKKLSDDVRLYYILKLMFFSLRTNRYSSCHLEKEIKYCFMIENFKFLKHCRRSLF